MKIGSTYPASSREGQSSLELMVSGQVASFLVGDGVAFTLSLVWCHFEAVLHDNQP